MMSRRNSGVLTVSVASLSVAWLAVLSFVETAHTVASCGAGVASIMRRTYGVMSACSTCSGQLGVTGVIDSLVALPEWTSAGTRGVVVAWAWTVTLLFLVMADKEDLDDGGEEEEEAQDDRDGEDRSVKTAGLMEIWQPVAVAIRGWS